MRLPLACGHHYPRPLSPLPPPPITTKRTPTSPFHRPKAVTSVSSSLSDTSWRCLHKLLLRATAGALSFSLLASPFPSLAEAAGRPAVQLSRPPPSELCQDWAEEEEEAEVPPESITNEGLVEEAWEVVNESFLGDAVSRSWSPEKWLKKKQDFLHKSIQTRSRAHDAIQKMLASLGDPYTRFLSPSEFSKMSKYDVTGIGINLREVPDGDGAVKLKVLGIVLDGPAHSAGVRQGDELLSVNGVIVRGRSAFDVSSMLQGPKETFVTIEVKHGNCGPIQSIKVQRQLVARTPVSYRLEKIENGDVSVGYVHIKEFNALAKKDLVIALRRLLDSGASYMVLDLKDNLGGLVQAGIEVAKLFLDKGETITYTVGRDPQVQKSIVADTAPFATTPLIVLVNNRTASASEIVATALHDNCKAVLVGERTYGKGLIQSVFELHDGSGVVVTIGKYATPNHLDINGNGVEPDFPRLPALSEVRNYLSRCQTPWMG
ncbi:carboxyl-terminal-processing peptidase 1, chloroplastic [Phoenix dactylifera]|uniref:C-terminal processing peptidase n=1 Tax=Phoenix dactylifera TaxID=42345 RepID=A0A8B7MV39_PHODC|nr:carboxyl-terminal-processing peptidase 1, chloroplastic [Phoenix dactylifera]XP_017699674.1 carboxyl-terminal-processing peptidase 1, chloroplastic [Phoenix dactylifera]